jgi:hypothetical protein
MIGFTGASRTGKSTLARMCADTLGFHYHEMKTAEIMKAAGYDCVGELTIDERIKAQTAYLDVYEDLIEKLPRPVLVDRTPVDLLGYMMAEVGMHSTTPEQGEAIRAYAERALNITNRSFGIVFVVRPLGHYQAADSKAPANAGYQWHTQWLMEGSMNMLRHPLMVKVETSDLETRHDRVCEVIVEYLKRNAEMRQSSRLH